MQIAQVLAGYTLAEADLLRRAMGKKIRSEMAAQRDRFVSGAVANGVARPRAETIFELLAKFAEYGFPKGHAAAYALISYQTAWLKANHPTEFLAASMTLDAGNTDKLGEFRREAERLGIEVVPPCVNRSAVAFDAADGRVAYALCAVKGVGRQVAEHIVSVRGDAPFADLADFAARIDARIVNRRTLEALVNAGAFDALAPRREQAFAAIDAVLGTAQRLSTDRQDGIVDMFSADTPEPIALDPDIADWSLADRLARESAAIGFFLSAHPLDEYADLFARLRVQKWADFSRAVREGAGAGRLAATVAARLDRRTRKGAAMAILTLSDQTGSFECVAFSEQIAQYDELLQTDGLVIVEVEADNRPDGIRLRLLRAEPIARPADPDPRQLTIFAADPGCLGPIRKLLTAGGAGEVSIVVSPPGGDREYEVALGGRYRLPRELVGGIKSIGGVDDVRLG